MSTRASVLWSLVLGALLASGCGTTDASADASADGSLTGSTAITTGAPTTTSAPPPYSFDGSVPPPPLINTGTDYEAIYRSLSAYATWLLAHNPDESLVHEAFVVGSAIYDRASNDVRLASESRTRLVEEEQQLGIEVVSVLPQAVSLRVTEDVSVQRLVDQHGSTVDERTFTQPLEWTALLQADTDGRWRIASVEPRTV
jgi:hypothetical protein